MSAVETQKKFVEFWHNKLVELLQMRKVSEEDMAYLLTKVDSMKDERFKAVIANLIGWGDEEDAEMQQFCAVALEVISDVRPSVLRTAARKVELRSLLMGTERFDSTSEYPSLPPGRDYK